MIQIFRKFIKSIVNNTPILRDWAYFHLTWPYVSLPQYLIKEIVYRLTGKIKGFYFPYDKLSTVFGNILVGKNVKVTQRGGCYVQGWGNVFIGDYTVVTQNCIITSANHSLTNQDIEIKKEVIIGDHCWIASNACIMGGVILGPRTVVAAGSVVTKSFPEGYCLIAGNPAKFIKSIPKEEFVPRKYEREMYGYIPAEKFAEYKRKHLQHIKFHYDLNKVSANKELTDDTLADDGIEMVFAKNGITTPNSITNESKDKRDIKENSK